MRINLNLLSLTLLSAFLIMSCQHKDLTLSNDNGRIIEFGIGESESSTKTVYDASNNKQINWQNGDRVKVSCLNSHPVESIYSVTAASSGTGTLSNAEPSPLCWGNYVGTYNFYAAYPGDYASISGSNIRFNGIKHQPLVQTGSNYISKMDNAYMVAKGSSVLSDTQVSLLFNAAVTALDFELNVSQTSYPVMVESLTINLDNTSSYISTDGSFVVDCSNLPTGYSLVAGRGTNAQESVTGTITPVKLHPGTSTIFTIFIPPIFISASSASISLHIDGEYKSAVIPAEISGGTRRKIILNVDKKDEVKLTVSSSDSWTDSRIEGWLDETLPSIDY